MRRAALLLLCCAGCFGGSSDDVKLTPTNGVLDVKVSAPTGLVPKLVVTGPYNFSKTFTEDTQLSVPPGQYVCEAMPIDVPTSLVDTIYEADVPATLAVVAGKTLSVSGDYTLRPGTGQGCLT
jgi:hypothetical protein